MTDPTTPVPPAASALSEAVERLAARAKDAERPVNYAFYIGDEEGLDDELRRRSGDAQFAADLRLVLDAARAQGRTSPAGEGVERRLGKYCATCHAIPIAGYCNLAGCPTAPRESAKLAGREFFAEGVEVVAASDGGGVTVATAIDAEMAGIIARQLNHWDEPAALSGPGMNPPTTANWNLTPEQWRDFQEWCDERSAKTPMRCKACGCPRSKSPCFKCGGELQPGHPDWDEPALPDIAAIRSLAAQKGYAIAFHGSLERDFDLIAAPWAEDAVSAQDLADHIAYWMDGTVLAPTEKPLGRWSCNIQIDGWFKLIDLSVCPRVLPGTPETYEALKELLSGHDNLYVAHFGPGSDPRDDIAAKAARAALAKAQGLEVEG